MRDQVVVLPRLQLLLLSLLLAVSPPCSAYCPLATMDYQRCEKLYIEFEAALVAEPRNLYRLHEEFFPSSRSSPVSGGVIYVIPCIDQQTTENTSSQSSQLLSNESSHNLTNFNSSAFFYTTWSSSVLLAYLSPQILNGFQIQFLDIILSFTTTTSSMGVPELEFSEEVLYSNYVSWYLSLVLHLNSVERLRTCDSSSAKEVQPVLRDLTSWLKSYARAQGTRSSWHPLDIIQYKGYSYPKGGNAKDPLLNELPYLLLTVDILYLILVTVLLVKVAPSFYCTVVQKSRRGNRWYSYVWATVTIGTLINLTTLALELYGLRAENMRGYLEGPCRECSRNIFGYREMFEADFRKAAAIQLYKTITVFVMFGFDFFLALLLSKDSTLPIPQGYVYLSYGACCTFHYTHTKRSKFIQTFAIWSLLGFVHIVATSILPSFLWAVVFPAETVSVLALLVTLTYCTITFLALVLRNIRQICFKTLTFRSACVFFLPILTLLVLMSIIMIASIIYLRLITTRLETGSFGGFLVTFLPSVVLTVLGWIITKGNPVKFVLNRSRRGPESQVQESQDETEQSVETFLGSKSDSGTPVAIEMEAPLQPTNNSLKEPLLTN